MVFFSLLWNNKLIFSVVNYDKLISIFTIFFFQDGKICAVIYISNQPICADLVLAKNFVLAGTLSGECVCVHVASNSVMWKHNLDSPIFASPLVYDNNKYVIYAEVNGVLHCRSVEQGAQVSQYTKFYAFLLHIS